LTEKFLMYIIIVWVVNYCHVALKRILESDNGPESLTRRIL
jgi:hypothetical protein